VKKWTKQGEIPLTFTCLSLPESTRYNIAIGETHDEHFTLPWFTWLHFAVQVFRVPSAIEVVECWIDHRCRANQGGGSAVETGRPMLLVGSGGCIEARETRAVRGEEDARGCWTKRETSFMDGRIYGEAYSESESD
jgi:hypothetical protein